jgi:nucleotide-binding universal stress UspA family protein
MNFMPAKQIIMKTIMVLTDFSKRAEHAAEYAWQLALFLKADLLFYNAYHVPQEIAVETAILPGIYGDYSIPEEESKENLHSFTSRLKEKFQTSGQEREPFVLCKSGEGNLVDNVEMLLRQHNVWLIVMGDKSGESFFSHLIIGSDSNRMVKRANRPLLIIPEKAKFRKLSRIIFASDSLKNSALDALDFLIEVVCPFNAEIVITHVSPKHASPDEMNQHLQSFNKLRSVMNYRKVTYIDLMESDVSEALMKFAQVADSDMIALVQKRSLFYEQLFQESNTRKMMNYHVLPLLIFPASLKAPALVSDINN